MGHAGLRVKAAGGSEKGNSTSIILLVAGKETKGFLPYSASARTRKEVRDVFSVARARERKKKKNPTCWTPPLRFHSRKEKRKEALPTLISLHTA